MSRLSTVFGSRTGVYADERPIEYAAFIMAVEELIPDELRAKTLRWDLERAIQVGIDVAPSLREFDRNMANGGLAKITKCLEDSGASFPSGQVINLF